MIVNIFNKAHFDIKIDKYTFKAFKEVDINIGSQDVIFREIRSNKSLRVGKHNNAEYVRINKLKEGNIINFCYDIQSQHAGEAYKYVVESFSEPIKKHLDKKICGYSNRPLTKLNCRFFNSARIREQGKTAVGPNDIFFSHGIADKDYWIGKKIEAYKYAFVPGPLWEKRMRDTGYLGEIFIGGYTKLDPLLNKEFKQKEKQKPYVVWAPTHGYNSKNKGRSSYPQCLHLIHEIDDLYDTKLAMHPTSKMHNKIKHIPTLQELYDADVVIADAGSTLYEAWILGKPVIFPDWICKKDVMNHFKKDPRNFEYIIYSKQIGYHAKNVNHLNELIDIALRDGMKDEEIEFINGIYPENIRGKSGKITAQFLTDIAKSKKLL
jgi:hypothetical protein